MFSSQRLPKQCLYREKQHAAHQVTLPSRAARLAVALGVGRPEHDHALDARALPERADVRAQVVQLRLPPRARARRVSRRAQASAHVTTRACAGPLRGSRSAAASGTPWLALQAGPPKHNPVWHERYEHSTGQTGRAERPVQHVRVHEHDTPGRQARRRNARAHLLAALNQVVGARALVGGDEVGVEHAGQRVQVAHVGRQLPLQLKVYHLRAAPRSGLAPSMLPATSEPLTRAPPSCRGEELSPPDEWYASGVPLWTHAQDTCISLDTCTGHAPRMAACTVSACSE